MDELPIMTTHAEVRDALRDQRLSARSFTDDMVASGISTQVAHQLTPLFRRSGEAHRAHRALLSAAFTPRSVERLRPVAARIAARLADELVASASANASASDGPDSDGPAGDGEVTCELVEAFAAPLPPEVFAHLFGLPLEDRDRLAGWASTVTLAFLPGIGPDEVAAVEAACGELRAYAEAQIARRKADPGDDLVSRLLAAEVDGQRLDEQDVIATITGFIFAGSETTRRQLTETVAALAEAPDVWRRLAAEPDAIPQAVEEVLRHRPIVPGLTRVALEPCSHGGAELAEGDRLLVWFVGANHDPAVFDHPDELDIDRPNADQHVTFGWGPHFCLGAGLARVELVEGLRALLERFGPPELIEAGPAESTGFTAPDTLHVRFGRA